MRLSEQVQNDRILRNQYYKSDIVYVTKYSKWILKIMCIWPTELKGTSKLLLQIGIALNNSVLLSVVVSSILYIIFDEKDTVVRLKLLGLLTFYSIALMKHWVLTVRKSRIKDCIDQMQTDWKQVELHADRKMMLKYGRVGRNLMIICAVFMYTGGTIYHSILQYAIGTVVDEYNRTIKPLVYPTYSALFDVQSSPIYELVFALHFFCGFVIYSITAGVCGLAALFATHVCGQIDIIKSRLNSLVDGEYCIKGISNTDMRLIEIVEHHLRVLRFSATVETILQEVCFLEFLGSTFLICLLEYYCIVDWKQSNAVSFSTYTMLLVSLTFNIFILCYIGELLMEQAELYASLNVNIEASRENIKMESYRLKWFRVRRTGSIGLSCFMMDWYLLPTKTIHGIILIIAMSSNPAKISAGRIIDLSLSTFGSVLKTSLAYLSFLRTATR